MTFSVSVQVVFFYKPWFRFALILTYLSTVSHNGILVLSHAM